MVKWGNGAGLLLPKSVRESLGLHVGDRVRFTVGEGEATLEPAEREWTLHGLMKGYAGPKPEFIDPGLSAGKEVW